jgi:hypothetical protein
MGLRGPKKGTKYTPSITKAQAREAVRAVVQKHMHRMVRSQIAHACGIGHMFTRDKAGKFTKIESEQEGTRLLAEGTEGQDYWIFFKDPSVQAFTDLMNRALDKPKEQEIEVKVTHELEIVPARLAEARKRLAAATAAIEQATEPQTVRAMLDAMGPLRDIHGRLIPSHASQTGSPEAQPGEVVDAEVLAPTLSPPESASPELSPGESSEKPQQKGTASDM